jgi:sorbitol-specific phosphotransferase system component IIBC
VAEPGAVVWRDLVRLSRRETLAELCLPVPWLALGLLSGALDFTPGVVVACLVVTMVGVRLNHGAVHQSLGLSSFANNV